MSAAAHLCHDTSPVSEARNMYFDRQCKVVCNLYRKPPRYSINNLSFAALTPDAVSLSASNTIPAEER